LKILYDGDIFLYKHCKASEEIFTFGEDLQTIVSDSKEARQKMEIHIASIQKDLEKWLGHPLDVVICFSGSDNWRKSYYPPYKALRPGGLKPVSFKAVKDWFIANYNCKVWLGLEADDVLGILATTDIDDCIVVSSDKDLRGVPGFLYNHAKDTVPKLISLAEADHFHMLQALMGDIVDGYKGCPSYGPKKALQALGLPGEHPVPELWKRVIKAYRACGFDEEYATVQATVARILRKDEWDFELRKCLWKPPEIIKNDN
jgi:DNA polymerase-1